MQSAAISTSADDSSVRLLGQGHSHKPHNEHASVVLSSSGSPLTPLVDSSNLTVRPGADDIPQFLPHRLVSTERSAGLRGPDGSFPDGTTRRRNTHIAETRVVHYPWHPWRNR